MSGFDENPFGEPIVDNPFADPAVQQATSAASNAQAGLDDYNPFAEQPQKNTTVVRGAGNPPLYQTPQVAGQPQPAIMQPTQETLPPAYARSGQQQQMTEEFQRRQEELERKAQELARREEELKNGPYNVRRNNWPPLPEKFCVQPCFYQDINVEIPLEFQRIVRMLYYLWLFHSLVLVLNFVGGLTLLFHAGNFTTFGLSILYLVLFTPFSFLCWYRPAYRAFRSDSSFNFMVFFFIFFFQFIVTMVQTIGVSGGGSCGFITAIQCFDNSPSGIAVGIIILVIAFAFGTAACMDILMLTKVHAIYRSSTTVSMAKAQQEFTSEFMRNQHVRNAASHATEAAVRSQLSNNRF